MLARQVGFETPFAGATEFILEQAKASCAKAMYLLDR